MKYATPNRLMVPSGHAIRTATAFTPACSHLLGTAFDRSRGDGMDISVVRWDRQGNAEVLLGRLRDGTNGRVFATDAGLVVCSATRVHDGVEKPLAFTVGSTAVQDLGAAYPGATAVLDMNAHGVFVGTSQTANGRIGYVATVNGMRAIVPPRPASEVVASAITDDGVVLGRWRMSASDPWRALVERGGVTEDLGEYLLFAVNQAQIAIGRPSTGPEHVCGAVDLKQRPIVWQQLAPVKGEDQIRCSHIDDLGRVCGYGWLSTNLAFVAEGFVHNGGAAQQLAELFGTNMYNGLVQCMGRSGAIAVQMHGGDFYSAEPMPDAPVAVNPRAAVRGNVRLR